MGVPNKNATNRKRRLNPGRPALDRVNSRHHLFFWTRERVDINGRLRLVAFFLKDKIEHAAIIGFW